MSSKVIFDTAKFTAKTKQRKLVAEKAVAEQIIADSRQYCPDDGEHILRDSARVEQNETTQVTYNTPYAALACSIHCVVVPAVVWFAMTCEPSG